MKYRLFILLIISVQFSLSGQNRFVCDGRIIISRSDGNTTLFDTPVFIPFSPPDFGTLGGSTGNFDALGFNPKDSYIYSVEVGTNFIIRHKSNNTFERIGKVDLVDTLQVNAGDSFSRLSFFF